MNLEPSMIQALGSVAAALVAAAAAIAVEIIRSRRR